MANYNDLDLPYDPLEDAPALGPHSLATDEAGNFISAGEGFIASTSPLLYHPQEGQVVRPKYTDEALNVLQSALSPYNKYAENLARKRHRLGVDVASENLKASRLISCI